MGNVPIQHDRAVASIRPMSTRAWLLLSMVVRLVVPPGRPGVYILGGLESSDGDFFPRYVGRSDTDVQSRLMHHAQTPLFTYFRCRSCKSKGEAYHMECFYWHALFEFGKLFNRVHPDAPSNSHLKCPYCSGATAFANFASGHSLRLS